MTEIMKDIKELEKIADPIYGDLYRCAVTLKDGTHLPCVILQSKQKYLEQAKKRLAQEFSGEGVLSEMEDPFGAVLSAFIFRNHIARREIVQVAPSKYAIPSGIRKEIKGETFMGWTGWVFEMKDGNQFSFGTSFSFHFFDLPDGYSFKDVAFVHNHAFIDSKGNLRELIQGHLPPEDYQMDLVYREKPFFYCAIDEI